MKLRKAKSNDRFDVVRLRKKIDSGKRVDLVTSVEQDPQVAGEDRRFA